MQPLETPKPSSAWPKLSESERETLLRETEILSDHEISELDTGKRIVLVRSILERHGDFRRWLNTLPFTERTGYRRVRSYERALAMWPEAVVEAALKRRLRIVGWEPEKPMGFFEDLQEPPKNLTEQKIEDYLRRAELKVRQIAGQAKGESPEPYELLKASFRAVERNVRELPSSDKDREKFLSDLVGLCMTLFGVEKVKKFAPTHVPDDFWLQQGGYSRSTETRNKLRKSAMERWERIREAKVTSRDK